MHCTVVPSLFIARYWFSLIDRSKHIDTKTKSGYTACVLHYNSLPRHILLDLFVILYKFPKTFHNFVLNRFVFPGSVYIYIFALVIVRALPWLVRTYLMIIINDRYSHVIGQARACCDLCPCAVAKRRAAQSWFLERRRKNLHFVWHLNCDFDNVFNGNYNFCGCTKLAPYARNRYRSISGWINMRVWW